MNRTPLARSMAVLGPIVILAPLAPAQEPASAEPLQLVQAERSTVVAGRVVREADGEPLAGATVRCLRPIDRVIGCATGWLSERQCSIELTTTDAHGRFRFVFPDGLGLNSIEVMPTADTGRASVAWRGPNGEWKNWLALGETVDVEVQVPASTRLQGTVVDEDGAGVAGAKVLLWRAGRPQGAGGGPIPADSFVVAEADGSFDVPATGDCTVLQAAAEDRFAVDALLANVGAGQSASGLKLTLHEVGHVDGVVVDPDGSALANVRVYAVRGEGREDWQPTDVPGVRRSTNILVAACGDAQGRFALGALPRDTLTIRVGVAPYLPWSCTLVPDGQSLRIALDAGATLMGTVRSADGQPLRGAILQTTANGGYRQLTDAQGTFRFVGVPPSRYAVVTVEAEGHVSRVLEGLVVSADRDNTLDVRLERELCIAGCVIKADGHALAHAAVDIRDDTVLPGQDVWDRLALSQAFQSLSGDQRHGFATTYTDDDGHFRFERLQAHHFQLRVGERPQLFSVMSGEESLVLQLACPEDWRRRLLGTVVDAETGQSIEDFEVSGQYDCTGPVPPDPPQKEGNRFIFDLYTGRVHVTVSAPDHEYWFGTFDGEEGRDHEQAIRLQPARRVTVSVVDEHGKALPKCDVSISCRGQPVKFAVDGCMCRGSASLGRSGRIVVERLPRDTLTIGILKSTGPGVRKLVSTRVIDLSGSAWTDELEFVVAADR